MGAINNGILTASLTVFFKFAGSKSGSKVRQRLNSANFN